jgi:hypothetical protein
MVNLLLTYIFPATVFFPIILFVFNRSNVTRTLQVVFGYLIMAAVVNITAVILATLHFRNLWLLHVYTVLETVILLFFFIQLIQGRIAKAVLWILLFAFPLACIINWLFLQNTSNFNTYTRSIEAILIIGAAAYYWLNSSKENLNIAWTDNPHNWIISGLLLYFASALFLFLFSNYLEQIRQTKPNDPIYHVIWVTHGSLVMIMYILFGIGFIKSKHGR